ncbi:hypothetical protein JTB14_016184 [Gonioctena quinquepunctata]|nr:hypothetical protein JTB14_016184 [Gonioctena quinquepunctata]
MAELTALLRRRGIRKNHETVFESIISKLTDETLKQMSSRMHKFRESQDGFQNIAMRIEDLDKVDDVWKFMKRNEKNLKIVFILLVSAE